VDFSAANALPEPVTETVGLGEGSPKRGVSRFGVPEPVCQGDGLWGPFFDYPGKRKVYVQWCAPPLSPRPGMYFNWSVLVPPGLKEGEKVPLELYFHRRNRSYAKPPRKFILRSIQIAGHDYPFSGWYGHNELAGTLKGCRRGVVGNHTQRRVSAFVEWAKKAFPIDPGRVIAVGADGAAAMALSHPDVFAYVLISDFQADVLRPEASRRFAAAWGPKSADIKDHAGRDQWGWAMLDKVIAGCKADLPLWVCKGYCWGRYVVRHGRGNGPVYDAMGKARQPLVADWTWASGRLAYWWKDLTETPEAFQITLVNNSRDATVDFTPRRLRKFRIAPGRKLRWETKNVPGSARRVTTLPAGGGTVTVGKDGLVTLKRLKIPARTALVIKLTRAK